MYTRFQLEGRDGLLNFKEYRRKHKTTWLQKNGVIIKIKDMETSHILNSINLMVRSNQESYSAFKGLKQEYNIRMKTQCQDRA